MVEILIRRSKLSGSLRCPASKSYSHRAIAIASLAENISTIKNLLISRDTLATLNACRALGACINDEETGTAQIEGTDQFKPPEDVIDAENSGTTIRMMTALSGLVRRGYTVLTGDESLRRRPMQPILDALNQLGVEAHSTRGNGMPPLIVRGSGMKGGTAIIDGSISSQFISGLLIASVYADSNVLLKVKGKLVSKPYVLATITTMNHFGVSIDHSSDMLEYHIKNRRYNANEFDVPSDFSTAALLFAAGALVGENLKVNGLSFEMPQGDSKIIEIMKMMGCRIRVNKGKGEAAVTGSYDLEGGNFDLTDTPDLLPVVSILALKAKGPVTIRGVAHARVKETDRVAKIATELVKLGAQITEFSDGLKIIAPSSLRNAFLESYNDHRLFMAFTIASMMTEESVVAGAQAMDISYPNFLSDMKNLGAKISL
jgi:3-phosphoshikimate 1-carboxyvinyltransferase